MAVAGGSLLALFVAVPAFARDAQRAPEPNTLVPSGDARSTPGAFPDRIVATPAQDAAAGFSVAWRTNSAVKAPGLEIVVAGDSPDMGEPRRVQAITQALRTENGIAHQHRADVEGLSPDTLYAWRVQGAGIWWSPWRQLRTAGAPGTPLVMLYFADTQNKNARSEEHTSELQALMHISSPVLCL